MKPVNRLIKTTFLLKAKKVSFECKRFLGKDILDLGAGRCYIAREIKNKNDVNITCLDIDDLNETDMKLNLYNGKKLPYSNNSFDTVLIVYVLHHCTDIISTLKEAVRVSRKNIIIFEDFGKSIFLHPMDYISNKLHNVEAPLNFKTEKQWISLFRKLDLKVKVIRRGVEKQVFYPFVKHTMFVLEVDK